MNNETLFDTEEFLREWATVQYDRNNTPEAIEAMERDIAPDTHAECRCEYCNPRANY
jgi:hypothetical protein